MNQFFKFNLKKIPFYYVSGIFQGTREWQRKELIQPGNYGLLIVLRGVVYLSIADHDFSIHTNEYLIVPPFKPAKGFRKLPLGTKYIWIHFFPRKEAQIARKYSPARAEEASLPQQGHLYNAPKVISSALELINTEKMGNSYYSDLAIAQFLILMSADYAELVRSQQKNTDHINVAESVHKYLVVHFLEIDRLDDLNGIWGFSIPYLNRKFKKMYHISLYEFLLEQRLEYAKHLLALGNEPVYVVAEQSHFPDSKNFSRTFKKHFGVSPLQYRKMTTNYRVSTPTYDPVIPVSDKIMDRLMKDGLKWPKNKIEH